MATTVTAGPSTPQPTPNANASSAASGAVRVPVTYVDHGVYTVPVDIDGTPRRLQLNMVTPNVLLRCDMTDGAFRCPRSENSGCSRRRYTSVVLYGCAKSIETNATRIGDYKADKGLEVGVVSSDSQGILAKNTDGILGLALESTPGSGGRSYFSLESKDALARQWASFSLSLSKTNKDENFLLINGIDEGLIARKGLTAMSLPTDLSFGFSPTYSNFLIDGVATKYPVLVCFSEKFCTSLDPGYPFIDFTKYELEDFAAELRCTSRGGTDLEPTYFCPADQTFPKLGFTFGRTTLYVDGSQYTIPVEGRSDQVWLLLKPRESHIVLGEPFFTSFYTSFDRRQGITVYCKDGETCARDVIPSTERQRSRGDGNSSSTKSSGGGSHVGLIAGLVVAAAVFLLIILGVYARSKRRQQQPSSTTDPTTPNDSKRDAIVEGDKGHFVPAPSGEGTRS